MALDHSNERSITPSDEQPEPAEELVAETLATFISEPDDIFSLDPQDAPAALEALLFMAGDPIPVEKLATVTGLATSVLIPILDKMAESMLHDRRRGISCVRPRQVPAGHQARPDFGPGAALSATPPTTAIPARLRNAGHHRLQPARHPGPSRSGARGQQRQHHQPPDRAQFRLRSRDPRRPWPTNVVRHNRTVLAGFRPWLCQRIAADGNDDVRDAARSGTLARRCVRELG